MTQRGRYAKGESTRLDILQAALATIAANGFGGSSLRQIAAASGLSNAGVLHHFGSKEELFVEVLRLRDEFAWAPGEDVFDAFVNAIRRNEGVPGLVRLYSALASDAGDPHHAARPFFRERYRRLHREIASALREAIADGSVGPTVDPDLAARSLIALADGLQMQWLIDDTVDMTAHVEHQLALMNIDPRRTRGVSPGARAVGTEPDEGGVG